jgi:hypothetical protein
MQKTFLKTLTIILFSLSFFSCKKNEETKAYTCATCKNTPDALAANDASSKGIYKGVILASTGTVVFDVLNGGSTITAKLTINGVVANLTSSIAWVNGSPYVAPFTGTLNGQPVSITFSVGVSGQTPTVTSSNIPGHPNATFVVAKETSTSQIECYEGTYTGNQSSGTLNIILSKSANAWNGAVRKNGATTSTSFQGTVSGTTISATGLQSPAFVNGTLGTDVITNGTFNDGSGSGTWSANRTL